MSPKRQVTVLISVFASLGIGVSVGIIAAGGGLGGQINLASPPSQKDIFHIGEHIRNGTTLDYSLTSLTPQSSLRSTSVVLQFQNQSDHWALHVRVKNGTQPEVQSVIPISTVLTVEGQPSASFRPYYEPVRVSIFSIREMDYRGADKYLYIGAPWDDIESGTLSKVARITAKEIVQTQSGTYNAFVLSYSLASMTSKLWIDSQVPLPVKAQVYDAYDNLQYSFELTHYDPGT